MHAGTGPSLLGGGAGRAGRGRSRTAALFARADRAPVPRPSDTGAGAGSLGGSGECRRGCWPGPRRRPGRIGRLACHLPDQRPDRAHRALAAAPVRRGGTAPPVAAARRSGPRLLHRGPRIGHRRMHRSREHRMDITRTGRPVRGRSRGRWARSGRPSTEQQTRCSHPRCSDRAPSRPPCSSACASTSVSTARCCASRYTCSKRDPSPLCAPVCCSLPMAVLVAVGSVVSGRLTGRGHRAPMMIGLLVASAGAAVLTTVTATTALSIVVVGTLGLGLCSVAMPAMSSLAVGSTPAERAGLRQRRPEHGAPVGWCARGGRARLAPGLERQRPGSLLPGGPARGVRRCAGSGVRRVVARDPGREAGASGWAGTGSVRRERSGK